ncbi:2-haloacid dehalogenase [Silvimonas terrae]|uniref:2-haloacid dehalogenase n=1 Tax=Silvimonas terrae TaxID=300266 RepID=A0A840RB35_9NEIS|nr:HAD family hydrolase [Silvimonas terrae]MBB5189666.1 2-haloacid dehalogenase [Silvimonas terrae]
MAIKAVVFDLGGVLFDWDAEYVYRELIPDETERKHFLGHVCNGAWRLRQDAGQSLQDGTEELAASHPQYELLIRLFYQRWPDMLKGTLADGMAIFDGLRAAGIPVYALTNWAAETWPYALTHYPFLQGFRRIVVSGQEGMAKPALPLYQLTHERIAMDLRDITPQEIAFIDDTRINAEAATRFGWQGIHHTAAAQTAQHLRTLGLPL